jgi:hypothetical protein
MNLFDFCSDLKILASIYNKSVDANRCDLESIQFPKNFFLTQTVNQSFGIEKYMTFEFTEFGLEFCFHDKNEYKFLIKKEDWGMEDPPLFYNKKLYLNNSSAFLLIELADWYSSISSNVYMFSGMNPKLNDSIMDLFGKYIAVRGGGFYKHVKLTEKIKAFFISDSSSGTNKYKIVAQDRETLNYILDDIGLTTKDKEENKERNYSSDFISKGKIHGNKLHGEIWFISNFVNITVTLEEENPENKNFDNIVKKWKKIINRQLTDTEFNEIKKDLAKKISLDALSQTKTENHFIDTQSEKLYNDLKIDSIALFEDALSLLFKSKNEFPDYIINCVLDKQLSVDEYVLE